jgi:peptidyl-prolyl cis-trans isomerase SurA
MNKTKKILIIVLIFSVSMAMSAQEVVEAIVAIVNDDYISLSDYKKKHDVYYQILSSQLQGEDFSRNYEELKNSLMDMLITEILLLQEARRSGIDVQEQVLAQVERFKEQNGLPSDAALKQALNQQNMTYEEWLLDIERNLLQQAVLFNQVGRSIVIDDSELVGYYNQNRELFREPVEYTLRGIYVLSDTRSEEELKARMLEIDSKLAAGEDMAVLAEEYGEGPEKNNQGNLGTLKKGEMAPILEQAVEGLDTGQLSSWVAMPNGWYLLRLEEKKESYIKSFEDVRGEIEERLYAEKNDIAVEKYLVELKKRSFIKILIPDPLGIR